MNSKQTLFESMEPSKALLTLAGPTIISQLINVIYNIADTYFIGKSGNPLMIAGVSLVLTLFMLTVPIGNIFGLGGGSHVARMLGAKRENEIGAVSSYCIWNAAGAACLFSLILVIFLKPILNLLGATKDTWLYAVEYTQLVVILGGPFSVLSMVQAHILRNVGYSKQASLGLSGGGLLNIALDPLFMFIIFPSGQEVLGAAVATLISNFAGFLYLTITFNRVKKQTNLCMSPSLLKSVSKEDVRKVYGVGLPAGALPALFDLSQIFINSSMASCGDLQLAAIGIVQKVERIPTAFGVGISQSMMPLVAYNYTAKNYNRLKDCMKTARIYGILTAVVSGVLIFLLARPLSSIFLSANNSEALLTLDYATVFLKLRCIIPVLMFCNYYSSFSMQAIGDGKRTLLHAVCRILVFNIPILLIAGTLFGQNGYAAAMNFSELCAIGIAMILIKKSFAGCSETTLTKSI